MRIEGFSRTVSTRSPTLSPPFCIQTQSRAQLLESIISPFPIVNNTELSAGISHRSPNSRCPAVAPLIPGLKSSFNDDRRKSS